LVRGYCDESYDSRKRIYALAGFLGRDKQWEKLAKDWRKRCFKDGVKCCHAADCENRRGDFKHLSKDQYYPRHLGDCDVSGQ